MRCNSSICIFQNSGPACGGKDRTTRFNECLNIMCAALPEKDRFCELLNIYVEDCANDRKKLNVQVRGVCPEDGK